MSRLSFDIIYFQINNFYVDRYHPFKGCYLYELKAMRIGNLISESLYMLALRWLKLQLRVGADATVVFA